MASKAMGSLFVALGLRSQDFLSGIDKAQVKLRGFAMSAVSAMNPLTAILGGAGLSLSGAGIVEFIRREMEAIAETGKLAAQLGLATDSFSALEFAAKRSGVASEELSHGLTHMLKAIAEARKGTGEMADLFKDLGINLDELDPSDANIIGIFGDKINALGDAASRANAITKIFGRSGMELGTMLNKGSEGLAALEERGRRTGRVLSEFDINSVREANKALKGMGGAIDGIGKQIAVAVSPAVKEVAEGISTMADIIIAELMPAFSEIKNTVQDLVVFVHDNEDFLVPFVRALSGIDGIIGGIKISVAALSSQLETLRGGMVLLNKITGAGQVGNIKGMLSESPIGNIKGMLTMDPITANVLKVTEAMEDQIAMFGMTSRQIEIYKAAKLGASAADVAALNALDAQLTAMEKWHAKVEESKHLIDSLLTPQEKMEKQIGKLNDMFQSGLIPLEIYSRGLREAFDQAGKFGEIKSPEAVTQGSTAAFSAITRFENQGEQTKNVNERIAKILEEQKKIQAETLKANRDTADVLKGNIKGQLIDVADL